MDEPAPTMLFAGGGTGGHLFPSLAIAERLSDRAPEWSAHFACSDRPLDARVLDEAGAEYTPLTMKPLPTRPWRVPPFLLHYLRSLKTATGLIEDRNVQAVVAMGGFVSVPVVEAARKLRVPRMLVNLDAVPGKANRWLARRCDRIFSVYDGRFPGGLTPDRVNMPLRRSCLGPDDPAEARRALGLDTSRPVLVITGASQGAESINQMMITLAGRPGFAEALRGWQIVHLAGRGRDEPVRRAYEQAGLDATVLEFSNEMGRIWASADLAISRAGASSVAEVAVNAVPTAFLPYPYHRDQHQRRNALPLANAGAAVIFEDAKSGAANADRLAEPLRELLNDADHRHRMRRALRELDRGDGADRLAGAALELTRVVV